MKNHVSVEEYDKLRDQALLACDLDAIIQIKKLVGYDCDPYILFDLSYLFSNSEPMLAVKK